MFSTQVDHGAEGFRGRIMYGQHVVYVNDQSSQSASDALYDVEFKFASALGDVITKQVIKTRLAESEKNEAAK